MRTRKMVAAMAMVVVGVGTLVVARVVRAHCDTMDGPVVKTAQTALQKGDVTPVLKWVKKEQEEEVRAAFKKALAVRTKGTEARELADQYLFETLVRLHRAGEGAPYTGLKPAGTDLGPAVMEADKALEKGSADTLVKMVTDDAAAGIRERFAQAVETRKHAEDSVEAGRKYVEAYVEFVHYVERLHQDAAAGAVHHTEPETEPAHAHHEK